VTIMKRLAVGSAVLMIAGVALLHAQKSRTVRRRRRRQRHADYRRLSEAVLDHRRGDGENRRHDSVSVGDSRRTALSRDRSASTPSRPRWRRWKSSTSPRAKTVDTFGLSEGNRKVRIRSVEPDPLQRFLMMVTASATKLVDRFEVGSPTLVQYDLKEHRIVRTIPWPNGEERPEREHSSSRPTATDVLFTDQDG